MAQGKLIIDDAYFAVLIALVVVGYFLQTPISYFMSYAAGFFESIFFWSDGMSDFFKDLSKTAIRNPLGAVITFSFIASFPITWKLRGYIHFG